MGPFNIDACSALTKHKVPQGKAINFCFKPIYGLQVRYEMEECGYEGADEKLKFK